MRDSSEETQCKLGRWDGEKSMFPVLTRRVGGIESRLVTIATDQSCLRVDSNCEISWHGKYILHVVIDRSSVDIGI